MIGWLILKACGAAVWAYFRRIDADGLDRVPKTGAVILASNHVNSLVDPLVIQYVLPRRLTFTAKDSLAESPYLGFLMRALGVLRFHRPEESGRASAAAANRAAIQASRDHLATGEALLIFPEGKSHSRPAMLRFKQGLARIALGAEGPLIVVPVGLYYEKKEQFRSGVSVRFGEPIDVRSFGGSPVEFTQEVRRRIERLTVQYQDRREAPLAEFVGRLLATAGTPPGELRDEESLTEHARRLRLVARGYQQLRQGEGAAGELEALEARVRAHRKALGALGVAPADLYLPMRWGRALHFTLSMLEILFVGGAIAAVGWVNNILPFLVVRTIARKLSKERDQWASNAVYPAIVVYPLFYALQLVLAWLQLPTLWALTYTLTLPFSGAYYVLWRDRVGAALRRARTFLRWKTNPELQARLAQEGREIIRSVWALAPETPEA